MPKSGVNKLQLQTVGLRVSEKMSSNFVAVNSAVCMFSPTPCSPNLFILTPHLITIDYHW